MSQSTENPGLTFSRNIYERALDWYKSAESKAQIVLTLNGVFISFLGGNIFLHDETKDSLADLGIGTFVVIGLMLVGLVSSIVFALICLKSRFGKTKIEQLTERDAKGNIIKYDHSIIFFFDHLRQLKPDIVAKQVNGLKEKDEIEILSRSVVILSQNVKEKHRSVNMSFMMFGFSLIMFAVALLFYLFNV